MTNRLGLGPPVRFPVLLALVSASTLSAPAIAEDRKLPAGSVVLIADDPKTASDESERLPLPAVHFLVSRETLERKNAEVRLVPKLEAELKACAKSLRRATRPTPAWWSAIKWGGFGLVVGGVFFVGVVVGQ